MLSILNKAWLTCGCGENDISLQSADAYQIFKWRYSSTHTLNVGIVIKEHYIFYVYGYNKILLMNF